MVARIKTFSHLSLTAMVIFSILNVCLYLGGHSKQRAIGLEGNDTSLLMTTSTTNYKTNRIIKSILLWNDPHRPETLLFGAGREVFRQQECEYSDCELVTSPNQLPFRHRSISSYDAIIFNFIDDFWKSRLPKVRNPNQRYVFFTQESPEALKNFDDVVYRVKFNWTMTYRKKSDVPFQYGRIIRKESAPRKPDEIETMIKDYNHHPRFTGKKTKLVAWMASKCSTKSHREKYVKELQKYIPVDIYGECGTLSCERDDLLSSHPKCYDMIETTYKFYLSFENAICEDYVTEKFFNIINRDIIPIVFGGAKYNQLAPQHSYINAMDFKPKQLADYLKMLDADDTLYNQYFWWKNHYHVEAGLSQMVRNGFCELCKRLHISHRVKTYSGRSLFSQWNQLKECRQNLNFFPTSADDKM